MRKTIILLLLSTSSLAGIDEMRQRNTPKDEPIADHHNGNHNGGNPNVPIDTFPLLAIGFALIVVYGINHLRKEHREL